MTEEQLQTLRQLATTLQYADVYPNPRNPANAVINTTANERQVLKAIIMKAISDHSDTPFELPHEKASERIELAREQIAAAVLGFIAGVLFSLAVWLLYRWGWSS